MDLKQEMKIETERLVLMPMTYSFVSKVMDNDASAFEEMGVRPAGGWPNNDIIEILPKIKEKLSLQPQPNGFGAWLFIEKSGNSIIGDGGFKDAPDGEGKIDIGYGTIESKRRQGYTYEAVTALIKWGFSRDNVKVITANCLKSNAASNGLLQKLGMTEIKQDEEYIYFKLDKPPGDE